MEWNGMEWNGMEWNGMEWRSANPSAKVEVVSDSSTSGCVVVLQQHKVLHADGTNESI